MLFFPEGISKINGGCNQYEEGSHFVIHFGAGALIRDAGVCGWVWSCGADFVLDVEKAQEEASQEEQEVELQQLRDVSHFLLCLSAERVTITRLKSPRHILRGLFLSNAPPGEFLTERTCEKIGHQAKSFTQRRKASKVHKVKNGETVVLRAAAPVDVDLLGVSLSDSVPPSVVARETTVRPPHNWNLQIARILHRFIERNDEWVFTFDGQIDSIGVRWQGSLPARPDEMNLRPLSPY